MRPPSARISGLFRGLAKLQHPTPCPRRHPNRYIGIGLGVPGHAAHAALWWDEQHLVSPRHNGHRRVYLPAQVIEVTVIAELRRKGLLAAKSRRVLRYLQRAMSKGLSDALASDSEIQLLTDGKSIYVEDSRDRIIDILKNARQPMVLVCMSDQARRLEAPPKKPARSKTAKKRVSGVIAS